MLWPRTDPLFEIYPPTHPPLLADFSLRSMGDTLTSLRTALGWQASLTKIKELLVPEGWTLWSQPRKEKHPQREAQCMSGLNLNSSESWEAVRLLNIFIEKHFQITDQINISVTSLSESGPRQQTKPMAHV